MKKITIIYIIVISAFTGIFVSCKKEQKIYTGPTVVEFSPLLKSRSQGTVATPGYDSVKVQLIGAQRNDDLTLNYTIDASSTAVAGTHYNIPNSGSFKLPANSSVGYIRVNLVPGSIPNSAAASQKTLVLKLTGNADVGPSVNYSKYTLTITF